VHIRRKSFWRTVVGAVWRPPPQQLPRDQIIAALEETIEQSQNGKHIASVILFEIDKFRQVEETRDSAEVAHILGVVKDRMTNGPCSSDMVRGLGGGRFAIATSPLRSRAPDMLKELARAIQVVAEHPIRHPTQNTHVSVSVGYAIQTEIDAADGATLFEAANAALISAIRSGPAAICGFSPTIHEKLICRRELTQDARVAFASGDIHAHFQPQVDVAAHQIIGVEALARWQHTKRGMLPPGEFLPILEEAGMMQELGFTILRHALSALRTWDQLDLRIPTVSVNFSTEELLNPNLVDTISLELDAFDLTPDRLVIEILETVVAGTGEDMISRNINALHALGCAMDLDDFGTGHTSITTIRRFGVDRIKIDRSFVSNIGEDRAQQQMLLAILTMSQQLDVTTLAEGVETETELAFLMKNGCNIVQGYVISKPMPENVVASWMQTHNFDSQPPMPIQIVN
jgi:diguanylate cyclase (GGDEF)-like protein